MPRNEFIIEYDDVPVSRYHCLNRKKLLFKDFLTHKVVARSRTNDNYYFDPEKADNILNRVKVHSIGIHSSKQFANILTKHYFDYIGEEPSRSFHPSSIYYKHKLHNNSPPLTLKKPKSVIKHIIRAVSTTFIIICILSFLGWLTGISDSDDTYNPHKQDNILKNYEYDNSLLTE
jgi:hypothetical protein